MEASSYMKDASPGTNFTDVQTASAKRSLAKDTKDEGLIFSFYSTSSNFIKSMRTQAEVRFGVLDSEEVNNLLYKNNKNVLFFTASDNSIVRETYDNFKTYNLNSTGYNMYNAAVALYDCPSYYSLVSRHCDIIAVELLKEGGVDINSWFIPNWTYKNN